MPRGSLTRIENDALEINIPEAAIVLDPEHQRAAEGRPLHRHRHHERCAAIGEIVFASQTTLGLVLERARDARRSALLEEAGLPREGLDGKFDGQFKVTLPLLAELPTSAIKVEGKAHITDGRAKEFLGPYDVQGASIDLDITEKAVDANGQMLVNGVLAKVSWQRIFDAPLDKQPPLRITATLDNTDRNQLGLDVNHIVQGEVPIELTITRGAAQRAGDPPARRPRQRRPPARERLLAQAAGALRRPCSATSRRGARTRSSCRTSRSPATTSPSRAGPPSAPTTGCASSISPTSRSTS